jgi:hypothetical protein
MERESQETYAVLNRTFRKDLEPIFEMLEQKEKTLSKTNWQALVNETKDRVIAAPEQYLSLHQTKIPSLLITRVVDSIFEEG